MMWLNFISDIVYYFVTSTLFSVFFWLILGFHVLICVVFLIRYMIRGV